MIHRRFHGHSHDFSHLHSRQAPVNLEEAGQVEGLNLDIPEPLELGGHVGQIATRAKDEAPSGGDSNTTTIVISVVLVF